MVQLDDWVLCRIYKKNSSSSQKPLLSSSVSSKEYSHGSSSSSSSHLEDVLETLPEIDDRFFSLPRMNSLKTLQNDEKFGFQNLGSGNFDWASLIGNNSVPELNSVNNQTQQQGQVNFSNCGDFYVPSMPPPLCHVDSPPAKMIKSMEEEVQSGVRTNRTVQNQGLFQQNSNFMTQCLSNPIEFGFGYPNQPTGFGFRQ